MGSADGEQAVSDKPEASAEDAVSDKLSSDKLSLIAGAKEIAKLGHVGDELRKKPRTAIVALSVAKGLHVQVLRYAQDDSAAFRSEPAQVSRCLFGAAMSEKLIA